MRFEAPEQLVRTTTFDKVRRGFDLLARHDVDVNVLCTVNAANQDHPLDVYRFVRDELGVHHIQLIPIVERVNDTGFQEGDAVTDRSVERRRNIARSTLRRCR